MFDNLILNVSKSCNLRCPHCLWYARDKAFFSKDEMSKENAKAILDYFIRKNFRTVTIQSEGEILLYKDFPELARYATKIGFPKQKLITNGILVDEHIDFIRSSVGSVLVSIDGHNYEEYCKIRGGTEATFNRIVENIKLLVKSRINPELNFVAGKHNYKNIIPMIKFAKSLGISSIGFMNFHPIGDKSDIEPLFKDDLEVTNYIKTIKAQNFGIRIRYPVLLERNGNPQRCRGMLNKTVVIGPTGNFSPCCHVYTEEKFGNFFENPEGYRNKPEILKYNHTIKEAKNINDLLLDCRNCNRLIF